MQSTDGTEISSMYPDSFMPVRVIKFGTVLSSPIFNQHCTAWAHMFWGYGIPADKSQAQVFYFL